MGTVDFNRMNNFNKRNLTRHLLQTTDYSHWGGHVWPHSACFRGWLGHGVDCEPTYGVSAQPSSPTKQNIKKFQIRFETNKAAGEIHQRNQ